ncbi:hypothetical protein GGR50DRAFT_220832 [Xylaria sp. CBS 124048]|nr:hypothetical protein GGR50DRAFT_220832 [Xylaria sp. CBS 124048]
MSNQAVGAIPGETIFSTIVGLTGVIVSLFGLTALQSGHFGGAALRALDISVAMMNLASAISLTIAMRTIISCNATDPAAQLSRSTNRIIGGGCTYTPAGPECPNAVASDGSDLTIMYCDAGWITYAMQYVAFAWGLSIAIFSWIVDRQLRVFSLNTGNFQY